MKSVIITPENRARIFGRLNKFFSHRHLLVWHQYDCGMKKRISQFIDLPYSGVKHVSNMRWYNQVSGKIVCDGDDYRFEVKTEELYNGMSDNTVIRVGDKVAFLGNRIILRQKASVCTGYDYCYICFQISYENLSDDRDFRMNNYDEGDEDPDRDIDWDSDPDQGDECGGEDRDPDYGEDSEMYQDFDRDVDWDPDL